MAQRQGILAVDVRNPLTGEIYPAGTPIPMSAFARKVLNDLPAPTNAGDREQPAVLQEFTNDTPKAGGKVDIQISPRAVGVRPRRLARRRHLRHAVDLGTVGRRRQRARPTSEQAVLGRRDLYAGRHLAARDSLRLVAHEAGKNPDALVERRAGALKRYGITGLPTDPRVSAGLPTQLITGYSDLGRQATNPQWQYPTVFNPKVNYSWL